MKHFDEVTVIVQGSEFVVTDVDFDPEEPEDVTWDDFYLKSDPQKTGLLSVSSASFDEDLEEALLAACRDL